MQTDYAGQTGNQTGLADQARREAEDARQRMAAAAEKIRHEAKHVGSRLSTTVVDEIDRRKSELGDGLRQVADRMRDAGGTNGGKPLPFMSQAADLIENVSEQVSNESIRDIGDRLARFGRENPVTFIAACMVTGAVAARMFVAGSPPPEDQAWDDDMPGRSGQPAYGGYPTGMPGEGDEAPSDMDLASARPGMGQGAGAGFAGGGVGGMTRSAGGSSSGLGQNDVDPTAPTPLSEGSDLNPPPADILPGGTNPMGRDVHSPGSDLEPEGLRPTGSDLDRTRSDFPTGGSGDDSLDGGRR